MAAKNKPETPDTLADFEKSLAELEALVEELERGDIGLEDSLRKFERGVALARSCQQSLKQAELRVDQLLGDGDETEPDASGDEPAQ